MFIQTEQTPNPASLKFLPGCEVMVKGTAEFSSSDSAAASRRKSISIATERASVATASTGRSLCASSDRLSALRAT